MANIIKINDEYFVEFYGNGLLFQKRAGVSLEKAESLKIEIEKTLPSDPLDKPALKIPLEEFTQQFKKFSSEYNSEITHQKFQGAYTRFTQFLEQLKPEVKTLPDITPRVVEDYRAYLLTQNELNIRGRNFQLLLLRQTFEYAITRGWINDNPTFHIKMIEGEGQERPKVLEQSEYQKLLTKFSDEQVEIIECMYHLGLRFEEIQKLNWGMVNFESNQLRMADDRVLPINSPVLEILKAKSKESDELVFPDAGTVFDGQELDSAVLRDTFAHNLLTRGVPLMQLVRLMGFEDAEEVMRYFDLAELR